jgi:hypothetical protein
MQEEWQLSGASFYSFRIFHNLNLHGFLAEILRTYIYGVAI